MLCDKLLLYISLGEKTDREEIIVGNKRRKWIWVAYIIRQGKSSAEGSKVNRNPQGRRSIGATGYCNGFNQRVAWQQLCKHGPTRNNRLGCVSYVVRAEQR
jgi:hypothetical protein